MSGKVSQAPLDDSHEKGQTERKDKDKGVSVVNANSNSVQITVLYLFILAATSYELYMLVYCLS